MLRKNCLLIFLVTLICIVSVNSTIAQARLKVAVFAPVYLDSAFNGDDYKLGSNNLPKSMLPGLDFYNGVMMAIDSLESDGKDLEVMFYDSKGSESIYTIIRKPEFDKINLIIAAFNNKADVKPLAEIALHRNIPLISSTFPNDGGVTKNPDFVLINSSLKAHIEGIYTYLQKNFASTNNIYVRKKGPLEDLVEYYFKNASNTTTSTPFKYKSIQFEDNDADQKLMNSLDSNTENTIICGSLNETYATKLVKTLALYGSYSCTAIGMPTWDGIKELDGNACNGVNIIYSTPYNFIRTQPLAVKVSKQYTEKLNGRPSDMFFKGYESMFHFGSLLLDYPNTLIDHLSDKKYKLFNDFDIQPITDKEGNVQYLENKKLFFIKKLNGSIK